MYWFVSIFKQQWIWISLNRARYMHSSPIGNVFFWREITSFIFYVVISPTILLLLNILPYVYSIGFSLDLLLQGSLLELFLHGYVSCNVHFLYKMNIIWYISTRLRRLKSYIHCQRVNYEMSAWVMVRLLLVSRIGLDWIE